MTADEIKAITKELLKQAAVQQELNSGLDGYLAGLKKIKSIEETLVANEKIRLKLLDQEAIANTLTGNEKRKALKAVKLSLKILKQQTDELEAQGKILRENLKTVNKTNIVLASSAAFAVKNFGKLPGIFTNSFGKIKSWGLFEMDKAIKTSTLQMGLLGNNAKTYEATVRNTSLQTNELGMGVAELAKLQASYSDELGRSVMLGDKGLTAMAEMASATSLGAEGTSQMASDMENQGISAERTRDLIQDTMNASSKMGINGNKVVKNMLNGMKLLNKYNFKDGVKGLDKMAKTVTKLGVGMEFATGMADKLFDIEGAVDMSAQLQVMGGAWAKLADPFKLAYMARNDMAGLTEEMGRAAAASVHFNKEGSDFEISAFEMDKLRKVAEQTGMSYEELAKAGKNARKFSEIKNQIRFDIDDETKEYLSNTSTFKDGKAYIELNGSPKLVSDLSNADKSLLASQVKESKSLAQRAKDSQTFDDKLTNLINMFKTTMLPIVDGLNSELGPLISKMFANGDFKKQLRDLGKDAGKIVETGAWIVKKVAEAAMWLGPKGTLAILFGGKLLGWLAEKATWFQNGLMLSQGFNAGSAGGGMGGGIASVGKKALSVGGKIGLAGSAIGLGMDAYKNGTDTTLSKTDALLKTLDENKGKIALGVLGAVLAPFTGGLSLAAAAGIGATIGSVADSQMSTIGTYGTGVHDGIFNAGIHDGVIGKDFSKGRGIIQGGKITPIDNKDDLVAYKPNGPIDNSMKSNSTPSTMKIEFGEIRFKFDEIKVTSPGSPGVAIELLKDPGFIRSITSKIHAETQKTINGGVVKA